MRLKARQSVTVRTLTLTRLRRGFGGQALSLGKGEGKSPRPRHNFQMLAGETERPRTSLERARWRVRCCWAPPTWQ